jgi:formate hydrogenlyase transcriptional activator
MSVPLNSLSSMQLRRDDECEQIAQLATELSKRLAHTPPGQVALLIAEILQQVAAAVHVEASCLVEFSDTGAVHRTHVSRGGSASGVSPASRGWLLARLSRGELMTISRAEELPTEAVTEREQARVIGRCSILGIPGWVAGRCVGALVIDAARTPRRWPRPLVQHLQLLAEIAVSALQRARHGASTRTDEVSADLSRSRLEADNAYLKEEIKHRHDFDDIVGDSPALQSALQRLMQVAPTNSTALLLGPTCTGKELFARALHARSRRHDRPFVRLNCAALPPTLIESELFGHEKGAFTGAVSTRQGRFELADGGTIFLDEIGDLAPEVQVKFLRVLQEGEVERVGSSRIRKVDVRVIAATHQDLETAVAEGRFRADLYYRLSVYPIRLPSLQERPEDIPQLVWFFIHRHQRELGRQITTVPPAVMDALQHSAWPGNVRELENVVESALIASTGSSLQLDAPLALRRRRAARETLPDNLDAVMSDHIVHILERCGGRINGAGNAAERLGIHPNTLRFRMRKLGLSRAVRV